MQEPKKTNQFQFILRKRTNIRNKDNYFEKDQKSKQTKDPFGRNAKEAEPGLTGDNN